MLFKVITLVITLSTSVVFAQAQEIAPVVNPADSVAPVSAPSNSTEAVKDDLTVIRKSFAFTVTPDQVGTTVRFSMKGQASTSSNPNSVLNREFEVFIQSTNLNAGEKDVVTITAGEDLLDVTINSKGFSNYKYNLEPKTADLVRIELVSIERIEKPSLEAQPTLPKEEKNIQDEATKAPVKKVKRSPVRFASM